MVIMGVSTASNAPPNATHFDFMVAGGSRHWRRGGTAGLALSARLASHPNSTLTIEAGTGNGTDIATEKSV